LLEPPLNRAVQDNNILINVLLAGPFEAIKPYVSIQASVTSASDIGVSLQEGQKREISVTYCIHCCEICTFFCQRHNLM
jgi:hypothetical protein